MPSRNIVKSYGADQYYHVYNRGVNKAPIFKEREDYVVMLSLFKRHLMPEPQADKYGRPVVNYAQNIDLVAYCLMPNHYHLLMFLKDQTGLEKLMRSVMTAYSMYFNKKYHRVGSLFQNHFLASWVTDDAYLWHVSRYIHLNALDLDQDPLSYDFSSISYFLGNKHAEWLHPEWLINSSEDKQSYAQFVRDYEAEHAELAEIKHMLADL